MTTASSSLGQQLTTASRVCRVVELCTKDLPAPTQVFELPVSTRRSSERQHVSELYPKIMERTYTLSPDCRPQPKKRVHASQFMLRIAATMIDLLRLLP